MIVLLGVESVPIDARNEESALFKARAQVAALQADNLRMRDELAESELRLKTVITEYRELLARRKKAEKRDSKNAAEAEIASIIRETAKRGENRAAREAKMEEYPWNLRLYIRDKSNGETHLIGTDVHDRLYVGSDGIVRYENMQNGCGTEYTSPITIDVRGVYGDRCEYLLHCLKSVGEYEFVPTPDDEL